MNPFSNDNFLNSPPLLNPESILSVLTRISNHVPLLFSRVHNEPPYACISSHFILTERENVFGFSKNKNKSGGTAAYRDAGILISPLPGLQGCLLFEIHVEAPRHCTSYIQYVS